jgi:hypothetical protein
MKVNSKIFSALFLILTFVMLSCEDENENETKISTYNDDESHKAGHNCMSCHTPGGEGEGWFEVAGTVYDSTLTNTYPNATVKFYSGPNGTGTLHYTLQVDALGNFYTTEDMKAPGGLYVAVQGDLQTNHMQSILSSRSCNSCHGVGTERIWTK